MTNHRLSDKGVNVLRKVLSKASYYYKGLTPTDEELESLEPYDAALLEAVIAFDKNDTEETRQAVRDAASEYRVTWQEIRNNREHP
jgi:hypothetical protein